MRAASSKTTVLLVDDHDMVRTGLRLVLDAEEDLEVLAEARSGRQAVELVKKWRPDVVVMDIAMPLLNGFEATRQIMKLFPATKILILSSFSDPEHIDQIIAMGAAGFLMKRDSSKVLSGAIREIKKGNTFFSADIKKHLVQKNKQTLGRDGALSKKNTRLSAREAEVLQLIAEGKANKEIAIELEISIKTVEKHRQHLMEKLNIHDTAGLTRHAISAGIIENSSQVSIY